MAAASLSAGADQPASRPAANWPAWPAAVAQHPKANAVAGANVEMPQFLLFHNAIRNTVIQATQPHRERERRGISSTSHTVLSLSRFSYFSC